MKKIISLGLGLVFAIGAGASLAACGSKTEEGCLTIRYYKGGYGDEWLKDSINNFFTAKKGSAPVEGTDYKLIADASITANQKNYLTSKNDAPDVLMTQGGYETYIKEGLIENLSSVYETSVTKLDGSSVKIKDYMLPQVYQSVTRQMTYGAGDTYSWAMPWSAECFSLAYNETLLLSTVHTGAYTVEGLEVGAKWTKAPATIDELVAYFADVNAGDSGVIPFGWGYNASNWLPFIVNVWWAQIQGTKTSKIQGQKSFYDFFNFNDMSLLDQTGIQMGYDVLRSLIIDGSGNYINSDVENNLDSLDLELYKKNAAAGRYAVWAVGDFFENESIPDNATFTTKFMFVPNARGADGQLTTEKLTFIRTDEAFYIPAKAKNKDLAKEFLAFMCNESELVNYTKKSGGLRPFNYNPEALDSTYAWTEFQKSFFDIYNNADEIIMEYPVTTPTANVSPIYLYNKQAVHFNMGNSFTSMFSKNNKTETAANLIGKIKTEWTTQFSDWELEYAQYFSTLQK